MVKTRLVIEIAQIDGSVGCKFARLSRHCVKKQCGSVGSCFGGRMALDHRLPRVRTGVAEMRQD